MYPGVGYRTHTPLVLALRTIVRVAVLTFNIDEEQKEPDVNDGARSGGYLPGGAVILRARITESKSAKTSKA